ncbi:DNA repair exonuclease [Patescibacteria group bacterium]|nr:DNA repair exonuclease [Patescibacteria group bacterium]
MIRFIQTSDWQIGMKGGGLGEAANFVRETRIESIHNVLKLARDRNVDFVLLCGDIFEHNMVSQEDVRKVVAIFNQYSDIPIYLLPGNHDILGADCVYNRPIFQNLKHLKIIQTYDIIQVSDAYLHPCPILSRFITKDLTANIPSVHDADGIHIGVAHGSLVGSFPAQDLEDVNLPIDPECIERTGIDYLALGHWHGYRIFDDNRIAYAGTHEQTKYNEYDAGYCLLVQIDKKGDKPAIEPIKTGNLNWLSCEFDIKDYSSLTELKQYLDSINEKDMVRLEIRGELPLEHKKELDNMLEFQATKHKNFRVKLDLLNITVPTQLEEKADLGDPTLNQTDEELNQLLADENDPRKRRVIVEALTHLRRLGTEVEG